MTKWHNLQASLSAALSQREPTLPDGLKTLQGGTKPQKRFNVYRNNVALSLINVLTDTFPVVEQLVGADFFKTMAREFTLLHLPTTPVMMQYGAEFPHFIANYQPASTLGFLSDVAALEWARNIAFHAKDANPVAISTLANFSEDQIPGLLFTLHPSICLQKSDYPIVSIWQAHQTNDQQEQPNLSGLPKSGEAALIIRPHLDVQVRPITEPTFAFMDSLTKGATFAKAAEEAAKLAAEKQQSNTGEIDIPAMLAGLFNIGAVIDVKPSSN